MLDKVVRKDGLLVANTVGSTEKSLLFNNHKMEMVHLPDDGPIECDADVFTLGIEVVGGIV